MALDTLGGLKVLLNNYKEYWLLFVDICLVAPLYLPETNL